MKFLFFVLFVLLVNLCFFVNCENDDEAKANAVFMEGIRAYQEGRYDDAVVYFFETMEISAAYRMLCFTNIGTVYEILQRTEDALASYLDAIDSATKEDPVTASLLVKTGIQFGRLENFDEATKHFQWALRLEPGHAGALQNLAVTLERLRRWDDSVNIWQRLIVTNGDFRHHYNLALVLEHAGRFNESEYEFTKYLELVPDSVEAWYNLGALRRKMGPDKVDGMKIALLKTVELDPTHPAALSVLGGGLIDEKHYIEGVYYLEKAIENLEYRNVSDIYTEANLILGKAWSVDWRGEEELWGRFQKSLWRNCGGEGGGVGVGSVPAPAHMLLIVPVDLHVYRCWIDSWANTTYFNLKRREQLSPLFLPLFFDNRVKIGYLSGIGFQKSPGSTAIRGIFALHDRNRFVVECFPLRRDLQANDLRSNITRSCDQSFEWHYRNHEFYDPPPTYDEYEIADLINSRELNILIDVTGLSGSHASPVLAQRPAAILITWLEYPGSLGKKIGIDLIVSDKIASPPDFASIYAEKLLMVPFSYLPNDYRATVRVPFQSQNPLPPAAAPTLCAAHHIWKISKSVFSIWLKLLSNLPPTTTLRLQECPEEARERLFSVAEKEFGISRDRLIISPKLREYYEHMEVVAQCSLFLDSNTYNAHTSAADVLWGSVPVISLPGDLMVRRGAASLLSAALTRATTPKMEVGGGGAGEMGGGGPTIVRNLDDYYDVAFQLASNPTKLNALRAKLNDMRYDAALFDTTRWVRNWERGLLMMYESFPREDGGSFNIIPSRDAEEEKK